MHLCDQIFFQWSLSYIFKTGIVLGKNIKQSNGNPLLIDLDETKRVLPPLKNVLLCFNREQKVALDKKKS